MYEVETYDLSRPGTAGSDATKTGRIRVDSSGNAHEVNEKSIEDDLLKVTLTGGEGESAIPEDKKVSTIGSSSFHALPKH